MTWVKIEAGMGFDPAERGRRILTPATAQLPRIGCSCFITELRDGPNGYPARHGGEDALAGALLIADGRVLLGHRHASRAWYPDCWDVPGGHVEPGESALDALRREFLEELGVEIVVNERPADVHLVNDSYDLHVWVVSAWRGEVTNKATDEHDELGWFDFENVCQLVCILHGVSHSYVSMVLKGAGPAGSNSKPKECGYSSSTRHGGVR